MTEKNELKQVKDVFKDYHTINKELLEAKIKSMNLFKKTNSLELVLLTTQDIKIRDICSFENYLETRFGIKTIKTKIESENQPIEVLVNPCEVNGLPKQARRIEKEWIDIIEYLSTKHPMIKAILNNSKMQIDGTCANVMLAFKGKEFLLAKKLDELLANLLKNIYGIKYKVCYIEQDVDETKKRRKKYEEEIQKKLIAQVQMQQANSDEQKNENQENNITNNSKDFSISIEESSFSPKTPPIEDKDIYILPSDTDQTTVETIIQQPTSEVISSHNATIGENISCHPQEDTIYLQEPQALEQEETIILGTVSKSKENKVKIKEIEASNKKITIEGRIISCQARETKTGKGMLIYDIYDGTGTITCKSFTKNIEECNEVAEKIKKASGIKTTRKSTA